MITTTQQNRICVVDGDQLRRDCLITALNRFANSQVVGFGGYTLIEIEELVKDKAPNIIILCIPYYVDYPYLINQPMEMINAFSPQAITILVMDELPGLNLKEVLKSEKISLVNSNSGYSELYEALKRAARGITYVDTTLVDQEALHTLISEEKSLLSRRELSVLNLIAQGKADKEIARDLTISVGTVKTHVKRILGKLDVKTRAAASIKAMNLGLIGLSRVMQKESTPERGEGLLKPGQNDWEVFQKTKATYELIDGKKISNEEMFKIILDMFRVSR